MAVGYLASSFDLLNIADLDLVAQVGKRCTSVVAGVLSDDLVEALYGRRPVVPCRERMTLVGHLRGVDRVVEQTAVGVPDEVAAAGKVLGFVVAGEPRVLEGPVVEVTPARLTASEVVRSALRPAAPEAAEAVA